MTTVLNLTAELENHTPDTDEYFGPGDVSIRLNGYEVWRVTSEYYRDDDGAVDRAVEDFADRLKELLTP